MYILESYYSPLAESFHQHVTRIPGMYRPQNVMNRSYVSNNRFRWCYGSIQICRKRCLADS